MSSEEYARTVFTQAIAEHLELRERNRLLEERMPLRDYLPLDHIPQASPSPLPFAAMEGGAWFDVEDDQLGWAA